MGSLNYSDIPYPQIMLKHLYIMQQSNKMCDMVLLVEKDEIYVHKLILSAVSPYFSALDHAEFKENVENKIVFHDISKTTLETIVQFIYTGDIEINDTNVYEIMSAANIFQISLLKLPISHYLISSLDSTNCLETLAFAELYSYDEVFCETLKFIAENFHFVVGRDIFLQAPANIVKHVLCQRGLNLKIILNTLGRWMKHNGNITDFNFSDEISNEHLESTCNVIIQNNPQFSDIITTVLDFVKQYYCDQEKNLLKNGVHIKEVQVLLAIGGSSHCTIHPTLEAFSTAWSCSLPSSEYDTISVVPTMNTPRMCFTVAVPSRRSDVVYVLGGLGPHSTGRALCGCERYNVEANEWEDIPELPGRVKSAAATWIDGKVVVTGGVDDHGKQVEGVWEYLEKDNCWRASIPMLNVRSDHGAVNVMGTLYVLGGQGGTPSRLLTTVERYNSALQTWSRVSDMPEAKYEFGCVAINEVIYVIGGATKHFVLTSVHKYDTITDKWEQLEDMPVPKSSFGCTVRNGKIYCVGGSDIVHGPLRRVEIYNPQTNRWHYSSDQLQTPRSYVCAATLKLYIEEP